MYRIVYIESATPEHAALNPLCTILEQAGYQLLRYPPEGLGAGLEMLQRIKRDHPDVVLLDPTLPESFQLCQDIKHDLETEHIPVIFVHPGAEANGTLVKSFESGATDVVIASIADTELLARLQVAIQTKLALCQSATLNQQLNRMNAELYERNLQVEKELYTARQLQQSLLPPFLPDPDDMSGMQISKCHYKDDSIRITGVYVPCDALGGDIYDVIKFPNGTIGVAVADVSGHGVPAGFVTAIFKSSFYRVTHNYSLPGDILFHLNNELADIVKTGEYVTSVVSLLQPDETGLTFSYSGAGHPYPLYYNAKTKQLERLKENGTPLVWFKNMEYPTGHISLSPGDKILLYTDGVNEMRNAQGQLYGEEALERDFTALVQAAQEQSEPFNLLDAFMLQLSDFTEGHPLEDDVSVVLIEAS